MRRTVPCSERLKFLSRILGILHAEPLTLVPKYFFRDGKQRKEWHELSSSQRILLTWRVDTETIPVEDSRPVIGCLELSGKSLV